MTEIPNRSYIYHKNLSTCSCSHASHTSWQAPSQTSSGIHSTMGRPTFGGKSPDCGLLNRHCSPGLAIQVYISGNGLMILGGPDHLLQTIYHDDCPALVAVTIDETTGKIATASSNDIYVYRPYGMQEGLMKVTPAPYPGCTPSLTLPTVVPTTHNTSPRRGTGSRHAIMGFG